MGSGGQPSISLPSADTLRSALKNLLGEEYLRAAPSTLRIDGVVPEDIAEPGNATELASVLKMSHDAGRSVVPTGGGSKLKWGNPPKAAHLMLSTRRLNRVLEHAWGDMTATVEAGCVFADLQNALAPHGQRLALDPLWPERATIGGILATNDSGALRTRFGSLRDLILGATLALPDGTLAKSGGKVVKNVAGYDIAKLVTGSLGTLGVITQAIFRLHPIAGCSRSLRIQARDPREMMTAIAAILDSRLTPSAVQVQVGSSSPPVVEVLLEGTPNSCDAQMKELARLVSPNSVDESVPFAWSAREPLFATPAEKSRVAAVCKVSLLRSDLGMLSDYLARQSQERELSWTLVAQAVGIGLLRLEAGSVHQLRLGIADLRGKPDSMAGSLVILDCPPELKHGLDVWGGPGDTLALMKNIKAQFDPAGILNPGRFVGFI
jgi:glycolate oxidase FAD binding subunit